MPQARIQPNRCKRYLPFAPHFCRTKNYFNLYIFLDMQAEGCFRFSIIQTAEMILIDDANADLLFL